MGNVAITPGTGKNIATIPVTRDAVAEDIQAVSLIDAVAFTPQKIQTNGDALISALGIGGPLIAMVAPSANGTVTQSGPTGLSVHLPPGASYTYTIATVQPVAAPTLLITTANPSTATSTLIEQINLTAAVELYVTATTAGTSASSYRIF